MNFWAERLGQSPAPSPAPVPPPHGGQPWWATPTVQQSPQQTPHPSQLPSGAGGGSLYAEHYQPSRQLESAAASRGRCPECHGGDYFEVDHRQGPRCYSCGYAGSRRIRNSTQGVAFVGKNPATARAARQVTGSGFRPDIIIGHV